MKRTKWIFGVCLGILAFGSAYAAGLDDVARAASRAIASKTSKATTSRTTPATTKTSATATSRTTANSNLRERTVQSDSYSKNVASRTAATTPRNVTSRTAVASRTAPIGVIRRTTTPSTSTKTRTTNSATNHARTGTTRTGRTLSRAATNESGALIANYAGCRTVYYECMDEFCATKDTNLRRCACSVRANEFDTIKKQMSRVEDKMLDFNQRLLLVNMDAADATAINNATAGEDAFYATKDRTKSKQALDDIAKKLNTTFSDSDTGSSLAPISMSLNIDSAFDTVDSMMGSDTTTKIGPALYNAAIPVCRDIATEVCTEDELSLAVSGYQMLMEQDCNTVYKSYQSKADAARTKVFESSALLDMSRLDAYQTRNADDLLTCKRKMLEMLTDSTVCGANLQNCLDMTGKYIDPTTGKAFLTTALPNLENLITRPTANQTWTSANSNSPFLTYLKNKKTYLASAMENCQTIADSVWDAFIEDALSQIKLAQTAKMEEIRHACTTLASECLTSTAETIAGFDARALSIFGVAADRTANSLCSEIQTACTTLIDSDSASPESWNSGMTDIATNKTYQTIIDSCTQVGRNCIIQACKSISGNFDLCDDINFSANRHAILERTSCWPELLACVGSAGDATLTRIVETLGKPTSGNRRFAFYDEMYPATQEQIFGLCANECGENSESDAECARCRIAERIWGNCEYAPQNAGTNRILIPTSPLTPQSTLLAWFAINTGTATVSGSSVVVNPRSCVNTRCTTGEYVSGVFGPNMCLPDDANAQNDTTSDGMYCPAGVGIQMDVPGGTNCCYNQKNNAWGHSPLDPTSNSGPCCEGTVMDGICLPGDQSGHPIAMTADYGNKKLVCVGGTLSGYNPTNNTEYPNGTDIVCTGGRFVLIDNNQYSTPTGGTVDANTPRMVYYDTGDDTHETPIPVTTPSGTNFFIHYGN